MNWRRNLAAAASICTCICVAAPAAGETMAERLPQCLACHGETGASQTPEIPSLGGQPASYLLIQLYQFREKQRIAEPMNEMTKDFTDDDLRTYSDELAKLLPPAPTPSTEPALFEQGRAATQKYRCGFCHNPDHCAVIRAASATAMIPRWRRSRRKFPTGTSPRLRITSRISGEKCS